MGGRLWTRSRDARNVRANALTKPQRESAVAESSIDLRGGGGASRAAVAALPAAWPMLATTTVVATTLAAATAALQGGLVKMVLKQALVAYHAYERVAISSPLITKATTSLVAYVLGDLVAQKLAPRGGEQGKLDLGRTTRSGLAGFVSHGPQLHAWSLFLDRLLGTSAAPHVVVAKIVLDQTFFAAYLNAAYTGLLEVMQLKSPKMTWAKIRAAALPSLFASWKFWPAVHALTYSVVPHHLRVLWVDVVEVAWVALLATCIDDAKVALDSKDKGDRVETTTTTTTTTTAQLESTIDQLHDIRPLVTEKSSSEAPPLFADDHAPALPTTAASA